MPQMPILDVFRSYQQKGLTMKTYQVELKYVSYTIFTVEANSEEEAELNAWKELETDAEHRSDYGDWSLESIEAEA
jgi:hypothetical protein